MEQELMVLLELLVLSIYWIPNMDLTSCVLIGGNIISLMIAGTSLYFSVKKQNKEDDQDVVSLKIRVAVLDERLTSEINLLHKLEDKLEEIEKEIK